ncbi:MAG: D-alanine--D-alanine ligase, partial [Solirubrobacterales bacterium]
RETAERTVELLGLRSFARVDMLLDERDGVAKVLEADAIPGLTDTSLLPQAIEAAGSGVDEFVGEAVEEALAAA